MKLSSRQEIELIMILSLGKSIVPGKIILRV